LSAERIKKALGLFMADALPNGYFRLTTVDNDLKMIMQAFGITQELCLPTVSQLRKLKSVIDKAVMN
jgi:predicted O-methyltransferase YrrM